MLPAGASVGPVDLDHPHLLINQIAGQAGAVAAGALHADHTDLAVVAEPALQLPVAATISRELPVAEQASLCIEHGSVVGATVGVDPADDNPGPLGHAGWPFCSRTGQEGHAPAGRADTPVRGLGRASSYQVTRARPVACITVWSCRAGDSSPDDTKVRSVPSQTRRQDQVHDQDRPIFTGQRNTSASDPKTSFGYESSAVAE
jgi:hypothetical protein